MTPEQRRLRAQNAARARWSRHMAREDQAYVARQAIWDPLGRDVGPDRELTPQERAALTQSAAKRLSRPAQRGQGSQAVAADGMIPRMVAVGSA